MPYINKLSGNPDDCRTINYKTGLPMRLDRVDTFSKGELIKVVFSHEGTNVLQCDIVYLPRVNGLTPGRTTTRTWFMIDENEEMETPNVKVSTKTYTPSEQQQEAVKRRRNIIDHMTGWSIEAGFAVQVAAYFTSLQTLIENFINFGSDNLRQFLLTEVDTFLDSASGVGTKTIREYLTKKLAEGL